MYIVTYSSLAISTPVRIHVRDAFQSHFRVVAMSSGISGILLAKRRVDRLRLEQLREKNKEIYENR